MADKNCFLFTYNENDHTYLTCEPATKLLSIYSCDEDEDHHLDIYHNGISMIRVVPDTQGDIDVNGELLMRKDKSNCRVKLLNVEIFECKPVPQGNTSESKLTGLLSKSNQAKAPFIWYRHSPIYIFPAEITIAKLEKLLSAKITIENITKD